MNAHSTVSSVSPPPGLWGLVDDNVSDDELINGEVLGVGVGLGVLQQSGDESDRLLGPSSWRLVLVRACMSMVQIPVCVSFPPISHPIQIPTIHDQNRDPEPPMAKTEPTLGLLEGLGLASSTNGSVETSERNNLLVLDDIREVGVCLLDVHSYFH
jgi:hypothetical protein